MALAKIRGMANERGEVRGFFKRGNEQRGNKKGVPGKRGHSERCRCWGFTMSDGSSFT